MFIYIYAFTSIYFCLHLSKCLEKQFKCNIFFLYFHHAFHLAGKQNCFLCTLTKPESLSKACQPANKKSKPNSSCRSCSWKQIHKQEIDIEQPPLASTIQRWQSPPTSITSESCVLGLTVALAHSWESQHRALDADTGLWKQAVLLAALHGVSQSSAGGHASTRPNTSYYTCPQPDTTTDTFPGTSAAPLKLKMLYLNLHTEMSTTTRIGLTSYIMVCQYT